MPDIHPATKYATEVVQGDRLACRWVKLACQRHLDDLEHRHKKDLYFDGKAADNAIKFFYNLRLWKGKEYKGLPVVLAPHFVFILSSIIGWKYYDSGLRRFRIAYVEMGRKGAKSTFAGGLGAYFLTVDAESGAECYTAAVKKDQSKIVWDNIKNLTRPSIFARMIQYYKYSMTVPGLWAKCEPLSSDSKSLDGLDTHFASLDELHAHPSPAVHDLIVDSIGARAQPLILVITTAGFDQAGVCYQRREYLTKILKGLVQDDSFFGIIFTLDVAKDWPDLVSVADAEAGKKGEVEDDWKNEDVWVKANPGLLGVTESGKTFGLYDDGTPKPGYMTKIEDIRDKARVAKEIVSAQNNFLTKRMNIWTQQLNRWLSLELWDQNFTKDIYQHAD